MDWIPGQARNDTKAHGMTVFGGLGEQAADGVAVELTDTTHADGAGGEAEKTGASGTQDSRGPVVTAVAKINQTTRSATREHARPLGTRLPVRIGSSIICRIASREYAISHTHI